MPAALHSGEQPLKLPQSRTPLDMLENSYEGEHKINLMTEEIATEVSLNVRQIFCNAKFCHETVDKKLNVVF